MMLFSEIKAVLICRDQDFRVSLHNNEYMAPASAGIAELEHRESMQVCLRKVCICSYACVCVRVRVRSWTHTNSGRKGKGTS